MTPSRPTLLKAQVYFAYASGGTAIILALPAMTAPAISLSLLGYGIFSSLLCQHWKRSIDKGSMARGEHIASITIWAFPLITCLAALTTVLVKGADTRPDFLDDALIHPVAIVSFFVVSLFWFSIPLICSILIAKSDLTERNTIAHPTP